MGMDAIGIFLQIRRVRACHFRTEQSSEGAVRIGYLYVQVTTFLAGKIWNHRGFIQGGIQGKIE